MFEEYKTVRKISESICKPLASEDFGLQCMEDASPPKWHLAHTSWFFEEFLLKPFLPDYQEFHPDFSYLFNSYYESVGERHSRPNRGFLSRPLTSEVVQYRQHVDGAMATLLAKSDLSSEVGRRLLIGINHEQQHQELLLTDIKFNFSRNPIFPIYDHEFEDQTPSSQGGEWLTIEPGTYELGTNDLAAYDNEQPRHRVYLQQVALAPALVTNGEYLEFLQADGYQRAELWLSDGWAWLQATGSRCPQYWQKRGNDWWEFTLRGMQPLASDASVIHLNYFEADAYAKFRQCRLPTEAEWEIAAHQAGLVRSLAEDPMGYDATAPHGDMIHRAWQWCQSAYLPYPGFKCEEGALGEYNGKFMCNQKVLRGGSLYTPKGHLRLSYRNFFPTHAAWQRTGVRLVKDL